MTKLEEPSVCWDARFLQSIFCSREMTQMQKKIAKTKYVSQQTFVGVVVFKGLTLKNLKTTVWWEAIEVYWAYQTV